MPYAQVDDSFYDHPKILALLDDDDGLAAIGLWGLCLAYAHRQAAHVPTELAGRVPAAMVRRQAGDAGERLAQLLASAPPGYKHGLWEQNGSGWVIHDFAYWQELERAQAKSAQARRAANSKWQKAAKAALEVQEQLDMGAEAGGTASATAGADSGTDASATAGAMHITEHNRTQHKEIAHRERRAPDPPDPPDRFADFWSAYPRKIGKIKAREAWDKVMELGIDPAVVIAGAERYRDSPAREAKYTAHPSTWLNQGRWADEDDDPGPGDSGTEAAWTPY